MHDQIFVGFYGLGIMGKPMATNILKGNYPLSVFNRTASKMQSLSQAGAYACKNVQELVDRSQVIITMLPDSPEVEEVILGKSGLIRFLTPGKTIIDMSSIAPLISKKIANTLNDKRIEFLDAPVSGGEIGAIKGTLAIMVGGKQAVFEQYLPLLQTMGKSVVHVGPVGSGGFTKLVNQIIVAVNIAAMGEAMTFAEKAGLNTRTVFEAIKGGLAGSAVLNNKFPKISDRNFEPGFRLSLHHKDLRNVLETAKQLGMIPELTQKVQDAMTALCESGEADLDHGAIVRYFERKMDVIIGEKKN